MCVRFFIAALALMGFLLPAPLAVAATASTGCNPAALKGTTNVCLTAACDQPGATTMDNLGYNLIACLKDEATGNLVWKAMSNSGDNSPPGTLCGVFSNGWNGTFGTSVVEGVNIPCKGVNLSVWPASCPTNYVLGEIGRISAAGGGFPDEPVLPIRTYTSPVYSCIKQPS